MDLSIVIVNWNSGPYLSHLLDSLRPLRDEIAQVIVVDNGSWDNSESEAAGDAAVVLSKFQENQGFARAANIGIEATITRYVLLLNPDIRIVPETVRKLWEEMERRPRLAIACGALVSESNESQEAFQIRALPTLSSVLMDALFLDDLFGYLKGGPASSEVVKGSRGVEVEQPAAAFWLMRREGWEEIGGFDESFFPAWFEDVDFCKRLLESGWKIMFFPQYPVVHRGALSLEYLSYREFVHIYYSNLLRYWAKHHKSSVPLIWLPVKIGTVVRRFLAR